MVEVRVSRVVAEVLADEGDVAASNRLDIGILAIGDQAVEVQVSRVVCEVLGEEPTIGASTRLDVGILAIGDQPVEVQVSRVVVEVLAGPDSSSSTSRLDVGILAIGDQPAEVQLSRLVIECLARQGSAGPVTPLALVDDAHIFLHNWATKAELKTSFRTDVTISPDSGAESRRGLGVKPFRTMDLEWTVCSDATVTGIDSLIELERLEVLLRRMTDQRFQVPIYMDQVELSASYVSGDSTILMPTREGRFFPGARVVIVELDNDFHQTGFSFHIISAMTNDQLTFTSTLGRTIPAGSLVLPVMDCEVALRVKANYSTSRVPSLRLTVAEAPGASQLPPLKSDNPTGADLAHDGRPVWMTEPDWSAVVTKGRDRQGSSSDMGRAAFVNTEGDRSRQTHKFTVNGTRSEMWNVLEFFETRRGRLRSFWHIDQDQYMQLVDIDVSGDFVGISEADLDLADVQEEFDALGLVMADGSHYVREVSSIQDILTVYRITLLTPLPVGLLVADAHRIARARLVRFKSDEFTETWTHTGYMSATINVIEVLNEADFTI